MITQSDLPIVLNQMQAWFNNPAKAHYNEYLRSLLRDSERKCRKTVPLGDQAVILARYQGKADLLEALLNDKDIFQKIHQMLEKEATPTIS